MNIDLQAAMAGHLGGLDIPSVDAESVALAALLSQSRLAPLTRDIVRKAIVQTIENGRELDRLQGNFSVVGRWLKDDVSDGDRIALELAEDTIASKIDLLRFKLGVLNG